MSRGAGWTRGLLGLVIAVGAVVIAVELLKGDEDPGEPPPGRAETAVTETIEAAVATRNADDCRRLGTVGYLEQKERRRGDAAVAACQRDVFDEDEGLIADPVEIESVSIAGDEATAEITYEDGYFTGYTATVRLVGGGGKWKLARVDGFAAVDRGALERSVRGEIVSEPARLSPKAADCAIERLRPLSDRRFERDLVLSGSSQALYAPAVRCDRAGVVEAILAGLEKGDTRYPPELTRCARAQLRALADEELIGVLVDPGFDAALRLLFGCDSNAMLNGYRRQLLNPPYSLKPRLVECVVARLRGLPPAELVDVFTQGGVPGIAASCGYSGAPG